MVNGASYKYTSEFNGNIFFPREMFLADGDAPWMPMTRRRLAALHQGAGRGLPDFQHRWIQGRSAKAGGGKQSSATT